MTPGRTRVMPRALAAALIAVLALGALGLTACSALDPDNGKSVPMGTYAPIAVKEAVLESLASQGYRPDNPNSTYIVYASEGDKSAVVVTGTFYGPGKEKGVLVTFKEIRLSQGADGVWKVTATTEGVAPAEAKPEAAGEGAKGDETKGGAEGSTSGEATTAK
jgi:hypothetical protein